MGRNSIGEGADEGGEECLAFFEEGEVEEFVLGVGLGDGAGAHANGGEPGGGEVGGVGEPGSADELGARMGGEQFLDERILWVCFHRWVFVGGFDV